ncbi:DUF4954 family protein [Breznakiella homolactica]|uniref:DUF4954 family protein n=1 Tax=Breznakiella homolactica TaxID=2798577 RepID=A0A7T8B9N0_9SPIR|nr:DUF4954 family protein [Breznakiella homolactica]QQO08642.1 DUF4954 family protein [Breznakiella homolactica]
MNSVKVIPSERYGYDFIPPEYLPADKDEYWLRNQQNPSIRRTWRRLKSHEIEVLVKNENYCSDWDNFLVSDPFEPGLIRNSSFHGLIRIGILRDVLLQHHDFRIPAGIRNSTVISCDIGDDPAIQDCTYISHYIIGDRVILSRIDEMQTTNHAKFGNGVLKDGEKEDIRIWIDVMNEAGGRSVLPFVDMIPADAYLWAAYRDDTALTAKLMEITQNQYGGHRGSYGTVGSGSVIKSCGIIKDTAVGSGAYIKGANKLKNITILSSEDEPSQVGEGVEMVNGIVGYGSHVFYGSKAVRFVMGRNCNLKYGARLIHSVMGDNSTVSCCEILNNLIFPVHEQHHNNSFLIASLIQGMSNMAAGATIGSNHNSRANDGEIRAGRGFWPGLSVTLKHSSRFASFVLISKGDYPYELNITLPFSLVNNNTKKDRLEVMPAYFWLYNMYALERNSWKTAARDKRLKKIQLIETDYLAPDTAEEIIEALGFLENWMVKAGLSGEEELNRTEGNGYGPPDSGGDPEDPEYAYIPAADEEIPCTGLERHSRGTVILKPRKARAAYRDMLRYYSVKTLIGYMESRPDMDFGDLKREMEDREPGWAAAAASHGRVRDWTNLGGQIVPSFRIDNLREQIRCGEMRSWDDIHAEYGRMASLYPLDKARHAWSVLALLRNEDGTGEKSGGSGGMDSSGFRDELFYAGKTKKWLTGQVYLSRAKDFNDPFRAITYRNRAEMEQVTGAPDGNFFVNLMREELAKFEASVTRLAARL